MVNVARVFIYGRCAGAVMWDVRGGRALFEYEPDFVDSALEISPLMMPLSRHRTYSFGNLAEGTFMGLPGLLADALPDAYGKVFLDRWLAASGRTMANPVERLCYQGKRSMGALEFVPAQDGYLDIGSSIEISSLIKVAAQVLEQKAALAENLKDDTTEALANIIKVSTSAGGQRAKAVIAYNDRTHEVRSGQTEAPDGFEQWLLKLDGVTNAAPGDPQHFGEIEYVYSLLAKEAGVLMPECRLLRENGRAHFMVKRFDRASGNAKIHSQTLCGLAHFDYKQLRAYSYEQVFGIMRRLKLHYTDAEQMFRRMVFNVVARNQDDHTKNISFLMDRKGVWSLSPAYDVSWAYNPSGVWTSAHQLSVNGKWSDIGREDLLSVARGIHIKDAESIIAQVCDATAQWRHLSVACGIPKPIVDAIDKTLLYSKI